jgi:hypothetical protein
MSAEWGLPHLTTDQLRALVIALTNCLGHLYVEADPTFQKRILNNLDDMRTELKNSARVPEEILESIVRFRELLVGRRRTTGQ